MAAIKLKSYIDAAKGLEPLKDLWEKCMDGLTKRRHGYIHFEEDCNDRLNYIRNAHNEGVFNARDIVSHYEILSHIDSKIEEQKKVHIKCENVLQSLEKTLVDAHKDKKAIEIRVTKYHRRNKKRGPLQSRRNWTIWGQRGN